MFAGHGFRVFSFFFLNQPIKRKSFIFYGNRWPGRQSDAHLNEIERSFAYVPKIDERLRRRRRRRRRR